MYYFKFCFSQNNIKLSNIYLDVFKKQKNPTEISERLIDYSNNYTTRVTFHQIIIISSGTKHGLLLFVYLYTIIFVNS